MIEVFIVNSDGSSEFREIEGGLESVQQLVGGYVQQIGDTSTDLIALMNEDGKLTGLPVNANADKVVHHAGAFGLDPNDRIVGNVVFCAMADGNWQSISSIGREKVQKLVSASE